MSTANDTVPMGGLAVRERVALPPGDRTRDLTRIVRHALAAAVAYGPLDRAIRSAAGPVSEGSEDVDGQARRLAHRINALLTCQAADAARCGGVADPYRETVPN